MSEAAKKDNLALEQAGQKAQASSSSASKPQAKKAKAEPKGLSFTVVEQLSQSGDVVASGGQPENNVVAFPAQNQPVQQVAAPGNQIDVLEAQVKLIALYSGEAKVLESQLNKIIKSIYSLHPELKPQLMMMKKLIAEHANIEANLKKAKKVK